jgi:hypothetical protein
VHCHHTPYCSQLRTVAHVLVHTTQQWDLHRAADKGHVEAIRVLVQREIGPYYFFYPGLSQSKFLLLPLLVAR